MIAEIRAFVQSLLRNPEFRRAAGFEGSSSILGISPGAIRLGFFALFPLAVSIALMPLVQFGNASPSIIFFALLKFVFPTLLAIGCVEGGMTLRARIERVRASSVSSGVQPDPMPLVLGISLPYIAGACALIILLAISFLFGYVSAAGQRTATQFAVPAFAATLLVPLLVEIPIRLAMFRFGLPNHLPNGGAATTIWWSDRFCALIASWTLQEYVVVGATLARPHILDLFIVLGFCGTMTILQGQRLYLLLHQEAATLSEQLARGESAERLHSADSYELLTIRGVLLRLRENPIFLRAAGFMYIRQIGKWPEGSLRIALILGIVPLAAFVTQCFVGLSRPGFSTIVALTIFLMLPLVGLAATLDTLRTARTIDGKRVDGPLALTQLTFSDIAIGRCVGNAIFPILTGVTFLLVGVAFLITWVALFATGSASRFTAIAILTIIAWSPMFPEMSIRLLRQVVTGNSTPWRSTFFLLSIPFQYIAFSQLAALVDTSFFSARWVTSGRIFLYYTGRGDGPPFRIMAPLLLLFAAWRWRICWLLILSAGAAMEANMRAWWESGEHD